MPIREAAGSMQAESSRQKKELFLISKIHYFQPILANCQVDITIFILYLDLYRMEPVGAYCLTSRGTKHCYSSPAVTHPY